MGSWGGKCVDYGFSCPLSFRAVPDNSSKAGNCHWLSLSCWDLTMLCLAMPPPSWKHTAPFGSSHAYALVILSSFSHQLGEDTNFYNLWNGTSGTRKTLNKLHWVCQLWKPNLEHSPATYVQILTIFFWTCMYRQPLHPPRCGITEFQFQHLYFTNLKNLKEMGKFLIKADHHKEFSSVIRPVRRLK